MGLFGRKTGGDDDDTPQPAPLQKIVPEKNPDTSGAPYIEEQIAPEQASASDSPTPSQGSAEPTPAPETQPAGPASEQGSIGTPLESYQQGSGEVQSSLAGEQLAATFQQLASLVGKQLAAIFQHLVEIKVSSQDTAHSLGKVFEEKEKFARDLSTELTVSKEQLRNTQESLENANAELRKLTQEKNAAQTHVDSLQAELDQAAAQISNLNRELTSLANSVLPPDANKTRELINRLEGSYRMRALYHLHGIAFQLPDVNGPAGVLAESIRSLSEVICEAKVPRSLAEDVRTELNRVLAPRLSIREISPGDPIDETWMGGSDMQGCRKVEAVKSWPIFQGSRVVRKAEIVPAK